MSSISKTVLLIDDDPEEFELFEVAAVASNLPVNLFYINEWNDEILWGLPSPDFIFLDINMPLFDGFHWLKRLRQKAGAEVPVIMYSTTLNTQRVNLAYELGANLFLSKPDSFTALASALQQILDIDWSDPRQVAKERYEKEAFHLAY